MARGLTDITTENRGRWGDFLKIYLGTEVDKEDQVLFSEIVEPEIEKG